MSSTTVKGKRAERIDRSMVLTWTSRCAPKSSWQRGGARGGGADTEVCLTTLGEGGGGGMGLAQGIQAGSGSEGHGGGGE